jgi:hypothetical protein
LRDFLHNLPFVGRFVRSSLARRGLRSSVIRFKFSAEDLESVYEAQCKAIAALNPEPEAIPIIMSAVLARGLADVGRHAHAKVAFDIGKSALTEPRCDGCWANFVKKWGIGSSDSLGENVIAFARKDPR